MTNSDDGHDPAKTAYMWRIVMEGDLLEFAGITDRALFVGLGDRFQIWAPDGHNPRVSDLRTLARDSMDLLDPFDDEPEVLRPK